MEDVSYAIYLGKEYLSGKGLDGTIILRSTNLEDIANGFEACKPFNYKNGKQRIVCLKFVNRSDVDAYYKKSTKAIYAGFEYDVVEEKDNKILIVLKRGDDGENLKFDINYIDQEGDQKWIDKDEVKIKIIKENLL